MSGQESCLWWIPDEGAPPARPAFIRKPAAAVASIPVDYHEPNVAAAQLYDAAASGAPLPKIAAPAPKRKKKAAAATATVVIGVSAADPMPKPKAPKAPKAPKPTKVAKPKKAATPKKKKTGASGFDKAVANIAKSVPKGTNVTINISHK